jgi:hypothetical protein
MRSCALVALCQLALGCGAPDQTAAKPSSGAEEPKPTAATAKVAPTPTTHPDDDTLADTEPGDKLVLVELFSSQGCDSCPAADAYLGELPGLGWPPDKVVPLTFHVTYWDDLGWQDPYGDQKFDQRQISYATTLPSARADDENTIKGPYTPQLVVDGRVHFSGTLREVAQREITRASQAKTLIDLEATSTLTTGEGERAVTVDVTSKAIPDSGLDTDKSKVGLFAALAQRHVETEVPRGENAGKKLQEYWVVRDFTGPKLFRSGRPVNETRFELALPEDADPEQLDVVVFAQDLAGLNVHATTTLPATGTPRVAAASDAAGME